MNEKKVGRKIIWSIISLLITFVLCAVTLTLSFFGFLFGQLGGIGMLSYTVYMYGYLVWRGRKQPMTRIGARREPLHPTYHPIWWDDVWEGDDEDEAWRDL